MNRSNIHKACLSLSLPLLVLGFSGVVGPQSTGLSKGFGAVFFLMFLICNFLKNEMTDEELLSQKTRR